MPTREEQKRGAKNFLLAFKEDCPNVRREKDRVEKKCGERVKVVGSGELWMALEWNELVKYNAVVEWLGRTVSTKKKNWTVHLLQEPSFALSATPEPASMKTSALAELTPALVPAAAAVALAIKPAVTLTGEAMKTAFMAINLYNQLLLGDDTKSAHSFNSEYEIDDSECPEYLGDRTFGMVVAGKRRGTLQCEDVAIKIFSWPDPSDRWKRYAALKEIAAFAALSPHANIVPLLDANGLSHCIKLVFPRFDFHLGSKQCGGDDLQYIAHGISKGLLHMHSHGLIHGDLRPQNILVKGYRDHGSTEPVDFAAELPAARLDFEVCISDFGAAVPGDPNKRWCQDATSVLQKGVQEDTLWYKPPEVLLGDTRFNFAVDSWALACVIGELVRGEPVFVAKGPVLVANEVFLMFGKPIDGELVQLPHYVKDGANIPAAPWPPQWLVEKNDRRLIAFLDGLWKLAPSRRLNMRDACGHEFFKHHPFDVTFNQLAGVHGSTTVIQAQLDERLLQWMQHDPAWEAAKAKLEMPSCKRLKVKCSRNEEAKLNLKHEIPGYVSADPPECTPMMAKSAAKRFVALRVVTFMQELMAINRGWFLQLTVLIRKVLGALPAHLRGPNGQHFFDTCFADTAFCYGILQVMRPGQRRDPIDSDAECSLLHLQLTAFGRRSIDFWFDNGKEIKTLQQQPGSVYIGNFCAVQHQVVHMDPDAAKPLFEDVEISIVCQSDAFRDWGPMKDIVNPIVAKHLASVPLLLPDFRGCMARRANL